MRRHRALYPVHGDVNKWKAAAVDMRPGSSSLFWEKRIFFPLGPSRRAFYLWYELVFQRKPFIPHLGTSTRNTAH